MIRSLRRLFALQEMDQQLLSLAHAIGEAPDLLERAQVPRREAAVELGEAERDLELQQGEQRHVEAELSDAETLYKHLEANSAQVNSNAAYTALLAEMDAAKERISMAETQILELMEKIEEARERGAKASSDVERVDAEVEAEEQMIVKHRAECEAGLVQQQALRVEQTASIEPAFMKEYDRIAARKTTAMAVVSKKVCGGCRVVLPAQALTDLRNAKGLVTCRGCKRILIAEETLAAEQD